MKFERILSPIALAQVLLGARVIWRMIPSAGSQRIGSAKEVIAARSSNDERETSREGNRITAIVPVLNERNRLVPCLAGLIAQGSDIAEIIVVDGGSKDGTQQIVSAFAARDTRVRLVDAGPIPADWNGKAWGLRAGVETARPDTNWFLTIDADVRIKPGLAYTLVGHAKRVDLTALSVATLQEVAGAGQGLLHPSLLTTLVYRFGAPGRVIRRVGDVQANGQCMLLHRNALEACGGFAITRHSLCEDVTIARALVSAGYAVGLYEAGDLVSVRMYAGWHDAWKNWTRSLPMRDHYSGFDVLLGWLEVALVQALPLPLFALLAVARLRSHWILLLNGVLGMTRLGVLFGTRRAYQQPPWSYWLSPLCDVPVAIQLGSSTLRRRHVWRGRIFIRGGSR